MATLLLASPTGAGFRHRSLVFVRLAELALVLVCVLLSLPVIHAVAGIAVPDAVDQGIATVRGFTDVLRTITAALLMIGACVVSGCRIVDQAVAALVRVRGARSFSAPRMPHMLMPRKMGDDADASDPEAHTSHMPSRTLRSPRPYADAAGGSFVFRHMLAPPPRGGPVAQPGVR